MIVKRILLTGASGYLGQHLLYRWMKGEGLQQTTNNNNNNDGNNSNNEDTNQIIVKYEITALYHRMDGFEESVKMKQLQQQQQQQQQNDSNDHVVVDVKIISLDISSQHDIETKLLKNYDVCVHTAAISSPRVCETDPSKARQINIPTLLLKHLSNVPMIVLSTDQVYDGCKSGNKNNNNDYCNYYKEDTDKPNPLNIYGQTKYELEQYFATTTGNKQHNSSVIILRSSIILGPKAPLCNNAHDTFVHFIETRKDIDTTFYVNEYRTVVSVDYVLKIISYFVMKQLTTTTTTSAITSTPTTVEIYNMGGPTRVNRYDIATTVFQYFGWNKKHILETKQTSKTVPLDISMDSTKLFMATKIAHEPKTLLGIIESTFSSS